MVSDATAILAILCAFALAIGWLVACLSLRIGPARARGRGHDAVSPDIHIQFQAPPCEPAMLTDVFAGAQVDKAQGARLTVDHNKRPET